MAAPRRALALAGLVAMAVLAACGGGGSGDEASTTVEPSGWGVASADPSQEDHDPAPTTEPATLRGTGDEKPDPPSTTTTAPAPEVDDAEAVACQVLTGDLVPLSLDDGPVPDAEAERDDLLATAQTLVDSGPEILRPGASRVLELVPALYEDPDAASPTDARELFSVLDSLLAWTGSTCEVDVMAWGCAAPVGFTPVGGSIGTDEPADSADEPLPTPEDVVAEREGEAVEVDRTETVVLFAWLDEHGMVERTLRVQQQDGGWVPGTSTSCPEAA